MDEWLRTAEIACVRPCVRAGASAHLSGENTPMIMTIAIILLVLWLLGMVSAYTMGGFIHILLVLAIIVVLVRVIQGRRPI